MDELYRNVIGQLRRYTGHVGNNVGGIYEYDPGPAEPKRANLNEKIVQEEVRRLQRKNPKSKVGELREKVIEKHALKGKGR